MYLKGSKWSMNRRRQHFNWFRILVLTLLIAAGLYLNRYVIPATPSLFEATPTATRPPEAYLTEAEELFNQGKLNQAIAAYQQAIAVDPSNAAIYVSLAQVQVFAGDYEGCAGQRRESALAQSQTIPWRTPCAPGYWTSRATRWRPKHPSSVPSNSIPTTRPRTPSMPRS